MVDTKTFRVDSRSRLTKFVSEAMRLRDVFGLALKLDDQAIQILISSGPALSYSWKAERRRFTKRDEKRLAFFDGHIDGAQPWGRADILLHRNPCSKVEQFYQSALDEAQRAGVADAVASKLSNLFQTIKAMRSVACELSETEPPGTDDSQVWIEAESRLNEAIVAVRPFCPVPVKCVEDEKTDETAAVNTRMIDTLHRNAGSADWTARKWATHLSCAPSTISGQPAWQQIMRERESRKFDRQL